MVFLHQKPVIPILVAALFAIGAIVLSNPLQQYFTVHHVVIHAEQGLFEDITSVQEAGNILFLDTTQLAQTLQRNNKFSKDVVVRKKLPNTLEIFAKQRTPVVALQDNQLYLHLDADGFILFQKEDSENLPVMTTTHVDINRQGFIRTAVTLKGIQMILKTQDLDYEIATAHINMEANEMTLSTKQGVEIVVPGAYDPKRYFSSLQLLTRQFRIGGTKPATIDFRFDKPVVRFE